MVNANKKLYSEIAEEAGLKIETVNGALYGSYNGYTVILMPFQNDSGMNLVTSVCRNGEAPSKEELSTLHSNHRFISKPVIEGNKVTFFLSGGLLKGKSKENYLKALNEITGFLSANGYQNCCQHSGIVGNTSVYMIEGGLYLLNEESYSQLSAVAEDRKQVNLKKKENVVLGIIGALLGSIIGVVVTVLVGQLGYVSVWTGIIMGICAFKGYQLFAGKLSIKGVIVSILVVIGMVYLANRIDFCITLARELNRLENTALKLDLREKWGMEANFFDIFRMFPDLVKAQLVETSSYYRNLFMLYIFSGIGAVISVFSLMHEEKKKEHTMRLEA